MVVTYGTDATAFTNMALIFAASSISLFFTIYPSQRLLDNSNEFFDKW